VCARASTHPCPHLQPTATPSPNPTPTPTATPKRKKKKKKKRKKETFTPTATATPNPTPAPTNVFKKSVTKYFEIDFFPRIVIDFFDHKCFPKIDDKIDNAFKHP
jgi:hypothetical protein